MMERDARLEIGKFNCFGKGVCCLLCFSSSTEERTGERMENGEWRLEKLGHVSLPQNPQTKSRGFAITRVRGGVGSSLHC